MQHTYVSIHVRRDVREALERDVLPVFGVGPFSKAAH